MMEKDPERWRELAERATKEQDPEKLMELTERIKEILDENYESKHNGAVKPLSGSAA
jgi:hypothetical protein